MLPITKVHVELVPREYSGANGRLLANAFIVIRDCFMVRKIKIIDGVKGLFVSFPSVRGMDGTFIDLVHPLTRECRTHLEEIIFKAYYEEVERVKEHESQ